jgi:putative membrane protein
MKRLSGLAILAGIGAFVTLSAAVRADKPKNDAEWLSREITNNKAEVAFSEIALKRANSAKVKEFAEKMIKGHKKANEKLIEVAKNMSVTVGTELNRDQAGTIDGLKRLSGAAFDEAYIRRMVQDHERAVKSYEDEARNGTNAELKRICNDALPHLQEHLKEARQIANDLKAR